MTTVIIVPTEMEPSASSANYPELQARLVHWKRQTVAELRAACQDAGEDDKGNKTDLALRLALAMLPSAVPSAAVPSTAAGKRKAKAKATATATAK